MKSGRNVKSSDQAKNTPGVATVAAADQTRFVLAQVTAFALSFVIYLITAARTVTFEDSGLFALVGKAWGVAHPPGYPIYTLIAHIFSYLPIGELAFRVALFSAVSASAGVVLIFRVLNRLTGRIRLALPATLVVAFSTTYWGQAIVPEVYAFNIFLNLLFFETLFVARERAHTKYYAIAGLVAGLNVANHWPLFVLSLPAFLAFTDRSMWKRANVIAAAFAASAVSAFAYGLLYWRSHAEPEYSFLGPLNGIGALWKYIMRSYYASGDTSVLYSARDAVMHFAHFLETLGWHDFVPGVFVLSVAGFWLLVLRGQKRALSGLTYWLLSTSVVLLFLLRLEHNDFNRNVIHVFWIGPYVAFGILAGLGAEWFDQRVKNSGLWILTAFAAAQLFFHFEKNNLRMDELAKNYGEILLRSIPSGSVLVASTDGDVGPIAYVNDVHRPNDVSLYTGSGVFFDRRMFDPNIRGVNRRYEATLNFVRQRERVFSVKGLHIFEGRKELPLKVTFNGLTYKYSPFESFVTPPPPELVELAVSTLDRWVSSPNLENWPYHRETLLSRLCNYVILNGVEDHPVYERSPGCMQVMARHFAATGRREDADRTYMRWFHTIKYPVLSEKHQYVYHFMVNRLELINSMRGQSERQIDLFREGLAIAEKTIFEYPLCDNMVAPLLKSLKGPVQISEAAREQLRIFDECNAPAR